MSEAKVARKQSENLRRGSPKGVRLGGRQKGTPNKATKEFRETIQSLLDDNRENVKLWLAQVAAEDPDKALQRLAQLAEYAAPKLARTEVTGAGGKDLIPPQFIIQPTSSKP